MKNSNYIDSNCFNGKGNYIDSYLFAVFEIFIFLNKKLFFLIKVNNLRYILLQSVTPLNP